MTLPGKHAMSYLSMNVSYHLQFMPLYKPKITTSVRDVCVWRIHRINDMSAEISLLMSIGFCKCLESQGFLRRFPRTAPCHQINIELNGA